MYCFTFRRPHIYPSFLQRKGSQYQSHFFYESRADRCATWILLCSFKGAIWKKTSMKTSFSVRTLAEHPNSSYHLLCAPCTWNLENPHLPVLGHCHFTEYFDLACKSHYKVMRAKASGITESGGGCNSVVSIGSFRPLVEQRGTGCTLDLPQMEHMLFTNWLLPFHLKCPESLAWAGWQGLELLDCKWKNCKQGSLFFP